MTNAVCSSFRAYHKQWTHSALTADAWCSVTNTVASGADGWLAAFEEEVEIFDSF